MENIMMVEGEMDEVSEAELLEAMKVAHEAIKKQCQVQIELAEAVGSTVKRTYCHEVNDEELRKDVWEKCYDKAYAIAQSGNANKHARSEAFEAIVMMSRKKLFVGVFWMKGNVWTVVPRHKFVLSGVRWIIFRDLTDRQYLHVEKLNLCQQ